MEIYVSWCSKKLIVCGIQRSSRVSRPPFPSFSARSPTISRKVRPITVPNTLHDTAQIYHLTVSFKSTGVRGVTMDMLLFRLIPRLVTWCKLRRAWLLLLRRISLFPETVSRLRPRTNIQSMSRCYVTLKPHVSTCYATATNFRDGKFTLRVYGGRNTEICLQKHKDLHTPNFAIPALAVTPSGCVTDVGKIFPSCFVPNNASFVYYLQVENESYLTS